MSFHLRFRRDKMPRRAPFHLMSRALRSKSAPQKAILPTASRREPPRYIAFDTHDIVCTPQRPSIFAQENRVRVPHALFIAARLVQNRVRRRTKCFVLGRS